MPRNDASCAPTNVPRENMLKIISSDVTLLTQLSQLEIQKCLLPPCPPEIFLPENYRSRHRASLKGIEQRRDAREPTSYRYRGETIVMASKLLNSPVPSAAQSA